MVKVVPIIVLMFGVQAYILTKIHEGLGGSAIIILATSLVMMISAFIIYDVKHQVQFFEEHLEMNFFGISKKLFYKDIEKVLISERDQSFASLQLRTKNGKHTFFFIDDADDIKLFLESQRSQELKAAA